MGRGAFINKKAKGTAGERDIIHMFWDNGWAAIRSAGSGSCSTPSPDILAGNNVRKVAIEVKITNSSSKYFPNEEIENLLVFARLFGAEAWVAVRFQKLDWLFINPEDLTLTQKGHSINIEKAKQIGLLFSELIAKTSL
ncbi:MAG TPA: Holliday junction resolvase Hjc [Candidatus Woesearchaeota archaeon]|nr:Holliday junction resolvase Hjc [Candidatus Woesearchaeota archaeon]